MVDVQQTSTENKIIVLNSHVCNKSIDYHILHIKILAHYNRINNIETTKTHICYKINLLNGS